MHRPKCVDSRPEHKARAVDLMADKTATLQRTDYPVDGRLGHPDLSANFCRREGRLDQGLEEVERFVKYSDFVTWRLRF